MRDIDKALLSLPVLAVAVFVLLAANADPEWVSTMFTGKQTLRSELDRDNKVFNIAPSQVRRQFPER
ncbi:hypothetical protein [Rhizobium sp. L1K21]|uniref:hypothetical protein n=1 Tax=Rhizobium sp. L1K21 TaxID=2954933 RepID=UPI002093BAC6|nr:hypothetical protein [Rhizobium sp. L1K21]MCO6186705.1 hypothetical protein [Rhizobium sp. L1K21]